ncbi:MAG: hypothetical protein IEMM0002_1289 [bacterium]|nr:MAG: hypothetical protein IEMM0002_1289 [bacterium]
MKKIGFFLIAVMLMSSGTALAASGEQYGFWFEGFNWRTYFNVTNENDAGVTRTATITFYDDTGSSVGSTSRTVAPNAQWNFNTSTIGTISTSALTANSYGGVAVISGTDVQGYVTQLNTTSNAGFNFRIIDDATE